MASRNKQNNAHPHLRVHTSKVSRQLTSRLCSDWNAKSSGYIGYLQQWTNSASTATPPLATSPCSLGVGEFLFVYLGKAFMNMRVPATKFWPKTWTCSVLPSTVCHASWRKNNVMITLRFVVTWSVPWRWSNVSQADHNWRRNIVFPIRSATDATIRHLENASIATTKKKKPREDRSKGKVMLELFLDSNGIAHMEFIPEVVTVNRTRYKEILGRLRDSVRRKSPELWCRKNCLLLHENAPAHQPVLVQEELARQPVTVLPHPPYSPDLAPCDFYLVPRMKTLIRGSRFHSAEEVMTATRQAVRDLPANMFQRCFQQLYQRWHMCIAASDDYF